MQWLKPHFVSCTKPGRYYSSDRIVGHTVAHTNADHNPNNNADTNANTDADANTSDGGSLRYLGQLEQRYLRRGR